MKPITFDKYIKTCRRILESSADFDTEGLLYDDGRQLKINFSIAGVKYNLMTIGLQYDERSGYWYPYIELDPIPVIEESDDTETATRVFKVISAAINELDDKVLNCDVDYNGTYKAGDFERYDWKLPAYGKK